jgi:BirA family transcriptional regulator, biotin operon repressor / biotin---[acetyl-CoA-carboxylase] ligase
LLPTPKPYIQLGEPFIQILTVDSTNNYAHNLIKQGLATNGTTVFANAQTNGRGQMGKTWQTNEGENIIVSIVIDISTVYLQNQFGLVAMAALGCHHFFYKYALDTTAIKWGNDLYWNDKKAGGILIETLQYNNKRVAIVGIGININQTRFNNNLPNPVSLKQITGKHFNVVELAKELCNCVAVWYNMLLENKMDLLLENYNNHLYKKEKTATLKKGNIKFNCTIKQVNILGELEVENGLQNSFKFGEIEWMIE